MLALTPVGRGERPADPEPRLVELPEPGFSVSEVLVDVRAAGLNRADLLQLRGHYPPPPGESAVPGLELAGVIEAVGSEVTGWAPGARVMALVAGGGMGERAAVPAGQLLPVPERLSFEEAAAIPEAALTAWTNLVAEGRLAAGETVLISGANGGIGTFAVQLARELGGRVLAAGRSRERLEPLRALGIEELLIDGPGLAEAVRERTGGEGADLALDLVGGEHFGERLAALRRRGRMVLVGVLAGARAEIDLADVLRRRLRIRGSVLRARSREEKAELVGAFGAFANERLADGRLRPVMARSFPFSDVAGAYRAVTEGGTVGKVVVSMGPAS
jgi:putative PIG3 family NAD(P)H quinone oxidoreductase